MDERFQYSHYLRTHYSHIFKLCCSLYNIDKFENNNDDWNNEFFEYSVSLDENSDYDSSEDSIQEDDNRNPLFEALTRQREILEV